MRILHFLPVSFAILTRLWIVRDRFAAFTTDWFRAWAKRVRQSPQILRQGWFQAQLTARGARIAPTAFFSDPGLITGDLKLLQVGEESFIGRVHVAVHAPVTIGARACINDGAHLLTASHDITRPDWPSFAQAIKVEDYAWIATNAIILPGVTIGRGAVAGAGAVVAKDVPRLAVAIGNPARVIENRRHSTLDYAPTSSLAMHTAWCRSFSKSHRPDDSRRQD